MPSTRVGVIPSDQAGSSQPRQTAGNLGEYFDSEVVPSSLVEISPFLRVANEVESSYPRVAYICRFYAFDKTHELDPTSAGRGVRAFKTALLLHLDNAQNPMYRRDSSAMRSCYMEYADEADCAQGYQTAHVLFGVLRYFYEILGIEVDEEVLKTHVNLEKNTHYHVPYNILDLHSEDQEIMTRHPGVSAAALALRDTRGLPSPNDGKEKYEDILHCLQDLYGFQKDNVNNQREHLTLLLSNAHIRKLANPDSELNDQALTEIMEKLFENYKKWCRHLGRRSILIRLPIRHCEEKQRKLLYIALYLLIWGEAANLRFMPECLSFIFHRMAYDLEDMLAGRVCRYTKQKMKSISGGEEDAFLRIVVTPIYDVIRMEAQRSMNGKANHSQWRNYDDLNEYFWSANCLQLGWPVNDNADFFCLPDGLPNTNNDGEKEIDGGTANEVEERQVPTGS